MANDLYKTKDKEKFEFKLSPTTEQIAAKQSELQRDARLTAQNGYNTDSLKRENELLSRQLNDVELWQEQDVHFAERDKSKMQTRITRNDMILLYNDTKLSSDSLEMRAVKNGMVELDGILRQNEWDATDVFTAYNRVIAYMRNYEMVKHPFFPSGRRRKARVSALRIKLEAERDRFVAAMDTFHGQIPAAIKTPMDVLEGKHIGDMISGGAEEKLAVRKRELLGLKREGGKADGEQMQNIKTKFKELYTLLGGRIASGDEGVEQKNAILRAYSQLISDCNSYIKDHHPHTQEGKERLAFVEELKERSEIEQTYISSLAEEQVAEKGENALWVDAFGEASAMADSYRSAMKEIGNVFSQRTSPAKALTFIFSLSIVSDSDDTKVKILKDEIAQSWYQTYMNAERYKEMLQYSMRLQDDIAELYRKELMNPVPVRFLKDPDMDPMDQKSREAYARLRLIDHPKVKLYRGLNQALSGYIAANSFDEGENSLKAQGREFISEYVDSLSEQESEKYEENSQIAFKVSNLDNVSVLNAEAVNSYRTVMGNSLLSECKENLRSFVGDGLIGFQAGEKNAADKAFEDMKKDEVWKNAEAVFEKARSLGMTIPPLADVQKSKLTGCDPSVLGQEICRGLDFIQNTLAHYGDTAASEFEAKKKELYYKVAAKTMLRFSNVTDEGETAAEYELCKFLSETVFELAGKQVLKEVSEKAYIGDLAAAGAGGIFGAVERKRAEVEVWQNKKIQVDMGVTHLAALCNDLHEISDIFAKAFVTGLTDEEAERVKTVGEKIDTLLSSQKDVEAMDLVAGGLKGLRYETGFASVKALFAGGFRYKEAAEKIAGEMLLPAEEQQRLKEQKNNKPVVPEKKKEEKKESGQKKEKTDPTYEGVLNVLDTKVIPSVLIDNLSEKEKSQAPSIAAGYIEIQKALRSFKTGESSVKEIQVGTTSISLVHHDDGSIDLVSGQKVTALTNSASFMAERLEADITSNIRLYGKEAAYQIIVANEKSEYIGKTVLRSLCLHAIEGASSFSGSYFTNITTDEIIRISKYLLKGGMTEDQVREYVESVEDSALINGEETLTLLKDMEKQKDADKFVVFKPQTQQTTEEDGWTPEERGIIDLVSDIVFTQDTWIADETRMQPGQRLQKLILNKHMNTLVYMIQNKYNHGLDKMLEKLNMPEDLKKTVKKFIDIYLGDKKLEADVERLEGLDGDELLAEVARMQEETEEQQMIKDKLKEIIEAGDEEKKENKQPAAGIFGIFGNIMNNIAKAVVKDPVKAKNMAVEAKLRLAITGITVVKPELFADIEKKIDEQVEEAADSVQQEVIKNVDVLFSGHLEDEEEKPASQHAEGEQQQQQQNIQQPLQQQQQNMQQPLQQQQQDMQQPLQQQQQDEEGEQEEEEEEITKLELNMEKPLDPDQRGISDEEKERRKEYKKKYKKESRKKLTNVITENYVTGKRGQGKFLRLVLSNYFAGVSILDKRSMLAAAIKAIKPAVKLPENATEEQKQQAEKDTMGAYLGGILKGAGPLLQKMLQGIPMSGLPKELQSALDDMKSRLAPIPPQIVKAQMLDMVKRSNGRVTKIEITRALGAASVGQTFLCKMYGPGFENGKDVVVKLLRPDVRNRMMREKSLMRDCAMLTDKNGGMLATYEGQLLRIEEELDLTIEAANVEKGVCYDKHYNTVKSMKVDHTIDPTANSMVLEKASGTTVDAYMKSVAKEKKELMSQFYQYKEKNVDGKIIKEPVMEKVYGEDMIKIACNSDNASKLFEVQKRIQDMLSQLQKRQQHMADLAKIWVEEGIFKNGFYHGDMHAGNIMIDDEKVTVIDYGNATKLDADQQLHVTRVIMSAAAGNVSEFQKGFHALLKGADPKVLEEYDRKKDQLTRVFGEVLKLGDATTTGERIGACLIRAQELGVAIPAAINNFVQSQLRIQNAIAEMNEEIRDLQRCALQIFTIRNADEKAPIVDIGVKLHNDLLRRMGLFKGKVPDVRKELKGEIDREKVKKDFPAKGEDSDTFLATHLKGIYDVAEGIDHVGSFMDTIVSWYETGRSQDEIKATVDLLMEDSEDCFYRLEDHCNKAKVMKIKSIIQEVGKVGLRKGMVEEYNALVNDLDPGSIYRNTRTAYLRLRNLNKTATQEEKDSRMEEFLDLLIVARKKAYISGNEIFVSIKQKIGVMYNRDTIRQADKELEPYFNDLENGGAMLRKVYREIRDAQDAQRDAFVTNKDHFAEVEAQKTEEFLEMLYNIAMKQLDDYEQLGKKGLDLYSEPSDFFSIMGEVLFENKSAALDRLGGYIAMMWKYRNIVAD